MEPERETMVLPMVIVVCTECGYVLCIWGQGHWPVSLCEVEGGDEVVSPQMLHQVIHSVKGVAVTL